MVSAKDLPTLTKFVKETTDLLQNPLSGQKMTKHAKNINQVMKIKRPWGKIIGGAMLAVLGTALVATSIVVAVASFGAAAPVSLAGLALGGSIIAAGVTVAAGLSVGVGLTVTAGMFANRARKGEMAIAGEKVIIAGEKVIDNVKQHRDHPKKPK